MGCCQTNKLEPEIVLTQINTLPHINEDEGFNELPLSSNQSPLQFGLVHEDPQYTMMRISYETTNFSNVPYTKSSLEMAFVCAKL
jgi:hypothetical protein